MKELSIENGSVKPIRWYDSKNRRVYAVMVVPHNNEFKVEAFYNGNSLGGAIFDANMIPKGLYKELKLRHLELFI